MQIWEYKLGVVGRKLYLVMFLFLLDKNIFLKSAKIEVDRMQETKYVKGDAYENKII